MSDAAIAEDGYQPQRVEQKRNQLIMISGCSGSGKSTLLAELAHRGFQTFAEPGRQIVKEQLHIDGDALPWLNAVKFVDLVVSRAMHQMVTAAQSDGVAFFDRGIVDGIAALERLRLPVPPHLSNALEKYRYHQTVFLSPPWPEIFRNDSERRHSFDDAVIEYVDLERAYARQGYECVPLPKLDVGPRAEFILKRLADAGPIDR